VIPLKDLSRFSETIVAGDELVDAEVQFEKDAQGLTVFHGKLDTHVTLICQRCNGELEHSVHVDFCFSPVQGQTEDEHDALPTAYEPVEVDEHGMVNLLQLFEDELLLSIPIVPLHAEEECSVNASDMQFGELEPEQERPNPFAVLKELKRDQE
jgi:uncharacterized protein